MSTKFIHEIRLVWMPLLYTCGLNPAIEKLFGDNGKKETLAYKLVDLCLLDHPNKLSLTQQ